MDTKELIIAVPTDNREKAYTFYKKLGLELARDPDSDEIPEPLEFRLSNSTVLMIVPRDGFAYVSPDINVAPNGVSEYVLNLSVDSDKEVDMVIEKARLAGGTILVEPAKQFMGYSGLFKDLDGHLWMVLAP